MTVDYNGGGVVNNPPALRSTRDFIRTACKSELGFWDFNWDSRPA